MGVPIELSSYPWSWPLILAGSFPQWHGTVIRMLSPCLAPPVLQLAFSPFLSVSPFPCFNNTGWHHSLMIYSLSGCMAPHISPRGRSGSIIFCFEETKSHRSRKTCPRSPRTRTRLLVLWLLAFWDVYNSLDPRDATSQAKWWQAKILILKMW